MPRSSTPAIEWLPDVALHNYPAAQSYLSLVYPVTQAIMLVTQLQGAALTSFAAKDILRASGLSALGTSNAQVAKTLRKIRKDHHLSPILLVRGAHGRLIIADGYHRVCALYQHDQDVAIQCKIV